MHIRTYLHTFKYVYICAYAQSCVQQYFSVFMYLILHVYFRIYPPAQMPIYRELEATPLRRQYSSERQLMMSNHSLQDSLSQSVDITLII